MGYNSTGTYEIPIRRVSQTAQTNKREKKIVGTITPVNITNLFLNCRVMILGSVEWHRSVKKVILLGANNNNNGVCHIIVLRKALV